MPSKGINKVILIGHLGQDPEIRYTPSGDAIANIALATSESWRDKTTGEIKELTEWHRVVLFGRLAEVAEKYLHKGSQIYIEGRLRTRKWIDQSRQERYSTEVIVNITGTMQMLGGRQTTGQSRQVQNDNQFREKIQPYTNEQSFQSPSKETTIDFEDDIPF